MCYRVKIYRKYFTRWSLGINCFLMNFVRYTCAESLTCKTASAPDGNSGHMEWVQESFRVTKYTKYYSHKEEKGLGQQGARVLSLITLAEISIFHGCPIETVKFLCETVPDKKCFKNKYKNLTTKNR